MSKELAKLKLEQLAQTLSLRPFSTKAARQVDARQVAAEKSWRLFDVRYPTVISTELYASSRRFRTLSGELDA